MAASAVASFDELLPYLGHERTDVRKMALQQMAQFLQHEAVVTHLLSDRPDVIRDVTAMLVPGKEFHAYSADCLAVLINLSPKGAAARMMVEARAVTRAMVLVDKGGLQEAAQEMCLLLLQNLTSVSPDAVDALLQQGEGELREGYYFSQLVRRFVDDHLPPEELVLAADTTEGKRDASKWVGDILRNCAQSPVGRRLMLDDVESLRRITGLLSAEDPALRLSVAGLLKNLLLHRDTHAALCCADPDGAAVRVLCRLEGVAEGSAADRERHADVLRMLVEAASCLTASDEGTRLIDSAGAKKCFQRLAESPALQNDAATRALLAKTVQECDDVQDIIVSGPGAAEAMAGGAAPVEAGAAGGADDAPPAPLPGFEPDADAAEAEAEMGALD